ncbi:hypothetical protein [Rhizobium rhizogenes]|uniref:hypothetical protein n=1 Tax=Rhizobium rhizogenes TaxID=359 RepID=UPI00157161CB|nr:hypothetical protein [Rhizobium rhizogenes]NTI78391.1 hypothetical protein [Rhizobium rhizogenes]
MSDDLDTLSQATEPDVDILLVEEIKCSPTALVNRRGADDALGIRIDFHFDTKRAFFVNTFCGVIKCLANEVLISLGIPITLPCVENRNLSLRHFTSRPQTSRIYTTKCRVSLFGRLLSTEVNLARP